MIRCRRDSTSRRVMTTYLSRRMKVMKALYKADFLLYKYVCESLGLKLVRFAIPEYRDVSKRISPMAVDGDKAKWLIRQKLFRKRNHPRMFMDATKRWTGRSPGTLVRFTHHPIEPVPEAFGRAKKSPQQLSPHFPYGVRKERVEGKGIVYNPTEPGVGATDLTSVRHDFVTEGVEEFFAARGHHNDKFAFGRLTYELEEDEGAATMTSSTTTATPCDDVVLSFSLDSVGRPYPDSGELLKVQSAIVGTLMGSFIVQLLPELTFLPEPKNACSFVYERLFDAHSLAEEKLVVDALLGSSSSTSVGVLQQGREYFAPKLKPVACQNLVRDMREFVHKLLPGEKAVVHRAGEGDNSDSSFVEKRVPVMKLPLGFAPFAKLLHGNWGEMCPGPLEGSSCAEVIDRFREREKAATKSTDCSGHQIQDTSSSAARTPATAFVPKSRGRRWKKKEERSETGASTPGASASGSALQRAAVSSAPPGTYSSGSQSNGHVPHGEQGERDHLVEEQEAALFKGVILPSLRLQIAPSSAAAGAELEEKPRSFIVRLKRVETRRDAGGLTARRAGPLFFRGGEIAGLRRFVENVVDRPFWVQDFQKPLTNPMEAKQPATTGLSPYFANGFLSVRLQSLLGQLFWREFAHFLGYILRDRFETMRSNPFCLKMEPDFWSRELVWREDTDLPRRHPPAVRAGCTQLRRTGWIHHIMRHMLACYITRGGYYGSPHQHDKHVHWEVGRDWFHSHLIDYDWAINCSQWQWLSCSFLFYGFNRVYHPVGFAKKWDSRNGEYVKHWTTKEVENENGSESGRQGQPHHRDLDEPRQDAAFEATHARRTIEEYKRAYLNESAADAGGSSGNRNHLFFYAGINPNTILSEWRREDEVFGRKFHALVKKKQTECARDSGSCLLAIKLC
eukprot:g1968.t1